MRAYYSCYPMADMPWTLAEDRRLMRLYKNGDHVAKLPRGWKSDWWWKLAKKLGRTSQATQQRAYALLAGKRLANRGG